MAKTYRFQIVGNPEEKLALLKKRAAGSGIMFKGTTQSGVFYGMGLSGDYSVEGSTVTVNIKTVPFLMTYDSVAAMIGNYLTS